MNSYQLHPENFPETLPEAADLQLLRQLEASIAQRYYEGCDRITRGLLDECTWQITTKAEALTLIIHCPDVFLTWNLLSHLQILSEELALISESARIRVCPPKGKGMPFEAGVDEFPVYGDRL